MKQFAFFIFATLLISTAPTSGQLADPDKSAFTKMYTKGCIEMLNRDSDKIRDAYQMSAPLTKQEISNYCECGSSLVADFLSKEEYDAVRQGSRRKPSRDVEEKLKCVVVEKCKKHLNLPDPSQFQYEDCWKG
jgi:hypothetical protein